jgi:SAM-dependent methyltransferase
MEYVRCNLCRADDYTVLFPKGAAQLHQIVRCNHCGLMYANPQESVDCDIYTADDRLKAYQDWVEASSQYFVKQHVQLPDQEEIIHMLNNLFPERGKLLEIGSYLGVFLNRIRADGWDVRGLEPDPGPANHSRSKYGLEVIGEFLPNAGFSDDEFDAVIMLHVIEHVPNPVEILHEIHRILKTDGVLIVETPRFDSFMFKFLGRRERSITIPGHIYFFTTQTLQQILERNGFEVFRTDLVGRTLTLDRLLYNIGLILHSDRIKKWMASISTVLHLDRIIVYLNVRDMQRMYSRVK